jgi:hypothetical protein
LSFYGSESEKNNTLEKLLLRRQTVHESFQKFAFEMDLMFRKVYNLDTESNTPMIMYFMSERALPNLKPHLLEYSAKTFMIWYSMVVRLRFLRSPNLLKTKRNRSVPGHLHQTDTKPHPRWVVSNSEKRVQGESAIDLASKKATRLLSLPLTQRRVPRSHTTRKYVQFTMGMVIGIRTRTAEPCVLKPKKLPFSPKRLKTTPHLSKAQGNGGEE